MKLTRGGFLKSLAGLTFAGLPWPKSGLLLSAQAGWDNLHGAHRLKMLKFILSTCH